MPENLIRLYADLQTAEPTKEMAAALSIPSIDKRQLDLQYFTAVFVSSGMNLNNAYFLPSELIKARETIAEKPLDKEHVLTDIVGHLYSSAFAYKDGSVFDPVAMLDVLGTEIEKMPMNIVMAARLYKAVFPELAEEIASGQWKVSMECFFKDYDLIVNNIIIPRTEVESAGYSKAIGKRVKVVEGNREVGEHVIGRVLRDIIFCGCGLVKNPANLESVILETAAEKETGQMNPNIILDLTRIDSYMKNKKEDELLIVNRLKSDMPFIEASYGGVHNHKQGIFLDDTALGGGHYHMVYPEDMPRGSNFYFMDDGSHRHTLDESSVVSMEEEHAHDVYFSMDNTVLVLRTDVVTPHSHEVAEVHDGKIYLTLSGGHKHRVTLPDGTKVYTLTVEEMLEKLKKEQKEKSAQNIIKQDADGFEQLTPPEICVSFKRYVYAMGGDDPGVPANADPTPGMVPQVESLPMPAVPGAEITQMDKIVAENWCALFDMPCPVPGGLATHRDCFRWELQESLSGIVKERMKLGASKIEQYFGSLIEILREVKKENK